MKPQPRVSTFLLSLFTVIQFMTGNAQADSVQAQSYQDAISVGKATSQADSISIGLYGATTVACGATCGIYKLGLAGTIKKVIASDSKQLNALIMQSQAFGPSSLAHAGASCTAAISPMEASTKNLESLAPAVAKNAQAAQAAQTASASAHAALTVNSLNETATADQNSATVTTQASNELLSQNIDEVLTDLSTLQTLCPKAVTACQTAAATAKQAATAAAAGLAGSGPAMEATADTAAVTALTPFCKSVSDTEALMSSTAPTLKSQIKTVVTGGIICQGVMLGAGVADLASASQVNDGGKSLITGLVGAAGAAGTSYMTDGLQGAISAIKSNQSSDSAKLAATMGDSACWSTVFGGAEMAYHMYDKSQADKTVETNQNSLNQLNGTSSTTTSWLWHELLKANPIELVWSSLVHTADAGIDSSKSPVVKACSGTMEDTSSLLDCAATVDPVIHAALNSSENPVNALLGYVSQMGLNPNTFISLNPPGLDQIAMMMTSTHPEYSSSMFAALTNLSVDGKAVPANYSLASTAINPSTVTAQQAAAPTDRTATLSTAQIITHVGGKTSVARDPASAEDTTVSLFDRVAFRYQNVAQQFDSSATVLKSW